MAQHQLAYLFPIMRHIVTEIDEVNTEVISSEWDEDEVSKRIGALIEYVATEQHTRRKGDKLWMELRFTNAEGQRLIFEFGAQVIDKDDDE